MHERRQDLREASLQAILHSLRETGRLLSTARTRLHYVETRVAELGASRPHRSAPLHSLTHREREVLSLVAEGAGNKEIAGRLGIGVRTVESHRSRIMRALHIRTVAGLTRYALARGLVAGL